jgi:hypothetical protein
VTALGGVSAYRTQGLTITTQVDVDDPYNLGYALGLLLDARQKAVLLQGFCAALDEHAPAATDVGHAISTIGTRAPLLAVLDTLLSIGRGRIFG